MPEQALTDIRVLEYGHLVAGPYCTKLLADLGAEVIKIEDPGSGDEARRHEPFLGNTPHPERSGLFLYLNTNKLGITLNLKNATGVKIFRDLVGNADILVENNPPQLMPNLGLDYGTLSKINPRLIMTSVTPFGQTGPYRDYKAHDLNLWHMGGMGYITRSERSSDAPVKAGGRQADFVAGMTAAIATLGVVYSRHIAGRGCWIDVSEMECIAALPQAPVAHAALEGEVVGKVPRGGGGFTRCRDGEFMIGGVEEKHWQSLIELMGNPEWAKGDWWRDRQARIDNADFLQTMIAEWATRYTREEIVSEAQARHIPIATPNTSEDVVNNRQFEARHFFVDIEHSETGKLKYPSSGYRFSRTPWSVRRPAPLLGEHNEEIYCQRLGYTREDLVKLREGGVI